MECTTPYSLSLSCFGGSPIFSPSKWCSKGLQKVERKQNILIVPPLISSYPQISQYHSFKRRTLGVGQQDAMLPTPHLRSSTTPLKRHSLGAKGARLEPRARLSTSVHLPFLSFIFSPHSQNDDVFTLFSPQKPISKCVILELRDKRNTTQIRF